MGTWNLGGTSTQKYNGSVYFVTADGNVTVNGDDAWLKSHLLQKGWTINMGDDSDAQGTFDTATSNNDVMYIYQGVSSAEIAAKCKVLDIPIYFEEQACVDEMEICSDQAYAYDSSNPGLYISDNTHHITSEFSMGNLTLGPSGQSYCYFTPTTMYGTTIGTQWGNVASTHTLVVVDEGNTLDDASSAANKRFVFRPPSGNWWNWTSNMETLTDCAFEWLAPSGVVYKEYGLTTEQPSRSAATINYARSEAAYSAGIQQIKLVECGSGSYRALVVIAHSEHSANYVELNTVKYNDIDLTRTVMAKIDNGSSKWDVLEMWYLLEDDLPDSGLQYPLEGNWAEAVDNNTSMHVIFLNDVAQEGPEATASGTNAAADTITTNLTTSTNNAWVMEGVLNGNGSLDWSAQSGQTERTQTDGGETITTGSEEIASAGLNGFQWNCTGSGRVAHVLAAFKPISTVDKSWKFT